MRTKLGSLQNASNVDSMIEANKEPTEDEMGYTYIYDNREEVAEWVIDYDELWEDYAGYLEDWEAYTNEYN